MFVVYNPITAVGIDVSKSKNTVAIRRPRGEVVMQLFDVQHNTEDSHRIADCEKNIIHIWPCFCDRINFAVPKNRNFSTPKLFEFPAQHEKGPAAEFLILRQVPCVLQITCLDCLQWPLQSLPLRLVLTNARSYLHPKMPEHPQRRRWPSWQ